VSAPGLPGFDRHRPKFLDEPFSSFDAAVNPTVLDGKRALLAIAIRARHARVAPR
jgi:hypothetical protein